MAHPIWKSKDISLGTGVSAEYNILVDGNVIYSGKAWRRPDQSNITIKINDICADYLSSRNLVSKEFVVQTGTTEKGRVVMVNDWSYDESHDVESDGLIAPVNGRLDIRQYLVYADLASTLSIKLTKRNGSTQTLSSSGYYLDISSYGDVVKVVINGVTYNVVDTCAKYVLYYQNAYGGYDSLLIEGMSSEEDAVSRKTMSDIDGKRNYLNDISKTITLHTLWMTDEESLRMHHLLNSNLVYLHDLELNKVYPVILNNSNTQYKTYKSNGCKLFNYTIDVTLAEYRRRK